MAERIENVTPIRRHRVYPWEEWMDGSAWRIRRGVDFEVTATSMAAQVRIRAAAAGMTATARVLEDGEVVEFQFNEGEKAA